jgi:hypothetical protein
MERHDWIPIRRPPPHGGNDAGGQMPSTRDRGIKVEKNVSGERAGADVTHARKCAQPAFELAGIVA